jgi:hypothetical protein
MLRWRSGPRLGPGGIPGFDRVIIPAPTSSLKIAPNGGPGLGAGVVGAAFEDV